MIEYLKRYNEAKTWHEKATVMEIYHVDKKPTSLKIMAIFFKVSVGLVSENLRLAKVIHETPDILKCETRQDALKVAERRKAPRYKVYE